MEQPQLKAQNSCSPPGICRPGCRLPSRWPRPILAVWQALLSRFLWHPLSSPPCVLWHAGFFLHSAGIIIATLLGLPPSCLTSPPDGLGQGGSLGQWKKPRIGARGLEFLPQVHHLSRHKAKHFSCFQHEGKIKMHAKLLQLCLTLFGPRELYPARLLCPWDSPGKNTGVDCHFFL